MRDATYSVARLAPSHSLRSRSWQGLEITAPYMLIRQCWAAPTQGFPAWREERTPKLPTLTRLVLIAWKQGPDEEGAKIDRTSAKLKNSPGACLQAMELKPLLTEHRCDKEVAKKDLDYSVCFHISANHIFTIAVYHQESALIQSWNAIQCFAFFLSSAHKGDCGLWIWHCGVLTEQRKASFSYFSLKHWARKNKGGGWRGRGKGRSCNGDGNN